MRRRREAGKTLPDGPKDHAVAERGRWRKRLVSDRMTGQSFFSLGGEWNRTSAAVFATETSIVIKAHAGKAVVSRFPVLFPFWKKSGAPGEGRPFHQLAGASMAGCILLMMCRSSTGAVGRQSLQSRCQSRSSGIVYPGVSPLSGENPEIECLDVSSCFPEMQEPGFSCVSIVFTCLSAHI